MTIGSLVKGLMPRRSGTSRYRNSRRGTLGTFRYALDIGIDAAALVSPLNYH